MKRTRKGEDGEATRVAETADGTRPAAAPTPAAADVERYAPGDRIGEHYEVLAVHTGSMGVVYATFDHQGSLPRALKTLRRRFEADVAMRDLFVEEAALWVRLEKHPFIVRAFGVEEIDHRPYVVIEYVQGRDGLGPDLRSWIGRPQLTLPLAAEMALQIAQGMQHAVRKVPGLVHRDLKPANVLVDERARAMVTDFGLVRAAAADAGTPAYLSPEQWRGEAPTTASDVYAYGCVLYEMFSGRRVHDARTIEEWREAHLGQEPAAIKASNAAVPEGLEAFVRRCLAKRPEDRPATWDEVVGEAARWFHQLTGQPVVLDFSAYSPAADELNTAAHSLLLLDKWSEALTACDRALALDPGFFVAWFNKAMALHYLGRLEEALAAHDQAVATGPEHGFIWNNRGFTLAKLGRHEEALASYDRALALDPADSIALGGRGRALIALGRRDEGMAALDRAVANDPKDAAAWYMRALALDDGDDGKEAVAAYNRATALKPDWVVAWRNLGALLNRLGRFEDALAAFDHAIALDPRRFDAVADRGFALRNLGRPEEALAACQRAAALKPEMSALWTNLGVACSELGRHAEALAAFERALALNPSDAEATRGRAEALSEVGRHDEALAASQEALALEPTDEGSWRVRAAVLSRWIDSREDIARLRAPFLAAVAAGDAATVRALLKAGLPPDTPLPDSSRSALMVAAEKGRAQVARALIDAGATVDWRDEKGETALLCAAERECVPIAQALLAAGATVDATLPRKKLKTIRALIRKTPTAAALIKAARHGDLRQVKALLAKGVPVDQEVDNETALRVAAKKGHVEVVRRLLAAGADVNATRAAVFLPWTSHSALGLAAIEGHLDVVKVLLAAGADMGTASAMIGPGATPLSFAACRGRQDVVEALIAAGAPVDPDALALSMEKTDLRLVPAPIIDALQRHIEAQRKGRPPAGEAATIAPPCGCQSLGGWPDDKKGIRVVHRLGHQGWSEAFCLCTRCQRRWKVEEDGGYHFTLYKWSNVTYDAESAHYYK